MPKPKPKPRPKPHYITALVLTVLLAGCGTMGGMFEPVHAPVSVGDESPAAKALRLAHAAIDEANVSLTALNAVIGSNAESGVWTKAQAQGYLDQSKEYGKKVDDAREMLRLGNLAGAKSQAELVKSLILVLQKRVAEEARKEE